MKEKKTNRKIFIQRLLVLGAGVFCLPKLFVKKEGLRYDRGLHIVDLPLKAVKEPRAVNRDCV